MRWRFWLLQQCYSYDIQNFRLLPYTMQSVIVNTFVFILSTVNSTVFLLHVNPFRFANVFFIFKAKNEQGNIISEKPEFEKSSKCTYVEQIVTRNRKIKMTTFSVCCCGCFFHSGYIVQYIFSLLSRFVLLFGLNSVIASYIKRNKKCSHV